MKTVLSVAILAVTMSVSAFGRGVFEKVDKDEFIERSTVTETKRYRLSVLKQDKEYIKKRIAQLEVELAEVEFLIQKASEIDVRGQGER